MHDRAGNLPPLPGIFSDYGAQMPDQEGPALVPGETWRPRGRGVAREIVGRAANEGGIIMIRFLTQHGEFVTSEQDFRFWIERLSASVV